MKRILISIVLLMSVALLQSYVQEEKLDAYQNIKMLKQTALFVRLRTSDLKINGLKQKGKDKEAEEIKTNQEIENKAIVASFRSNFDFCKVYFFYSSNSTEVKKGNYKQYLFDSNFQKDSTFTGNNYLVGEFDESTTTHIDAFIIKDKNYVQLNSPFPFLTRCNTMFVATRTKDEVVKQLNKQLFEFWSKNK